MQCATATGALKSCCRNREDGARLPPSPALPACAGAFWQLLQTLIIFSISIAVSLIGAPKRPSPSWQRRAVGRICNSCCAQGGWGGPRADNSSPCGVLEQNQRDLSLIWRCSPSRSQPLDSHGGSETSQGAEGSSGGTRGRVVGAGGCCKAREANLIPLNEGMLKMGREVSCPAALPILCQEIRRGWPVVKTFS